MKRCPRCDEVKPLNGFGSDSSKRDGRMSHCRACCNAARMQRYYAKHDHEKQRSSTYYKTHREQKNAYSKRYYQENREEILAAERARHRPRHRTNRSEQGRANYMKRHGGIDEWARLFDAQNGLCYLCDETLEGIDQKYIHVDHDHECCPGGQKTESCKACRRGLAHAWCNQILGLCGENMTLLRALIDNYERVQPEVRQRIAVKARQGELVAI